MGSFGAASTSTGNPLKSGMPMLKVSSPVIAFAHEPQGMKTIPGLTPH